MANLKISQLPPALTLQDTDLFAVVQGTSPNLVTRALTLDDLKQSVALTNSLLTYKGGWNADTNTPTIPTASGANNGWYYIVSVGGNTNIDGITDWETKDWLVSNGTTWEKIDNSEQFIVDITHADLLTNITNSALISGMFYRITDFQTVHVIPNTSDINTGSTEPLICIATDDNKIHGSVYSALYPHDTIEYDVTDVLAEDSSTARKGKINYRKDNINNLETWYDFRAVKFRRWIIDGTGMTAWAASTSYSQGQVVFRSGDGIYKAILTHTSSASFSTDQNEYKWMKILDIPSTYLAWSTSFSEYGGPITANPASFQDYLTFESGSVNTTIAKCTSAPYNNIIFINGASSGNTFGSNCRNMTFNQNSNNNTFENDCYSIIGSTGCDNNIVKNNCLGIIFFSGTDHNTLENGCYQVVISGGCSYNKIGESSNNIWVNSGSNNNVLGIGCSYNILASGCQGNTIGNDSTRNRIYSGSSNNEIGKSCSNNQLFNSGNYNIIKSFSSGNSINNGAGMNTLDEQCENNLLTGGPQKNYLGKGCNNNTISNGSSQNTLGQLCQSNSLSNSSSWNTLGGGCFNNTFTNATNNNVLGSNCTNNSIGNGGSNILGDTCSYNSIDNGCSMNVLGTHCNSNSFTNAASGNKIEGDSSNNTFQASSYNLVGLNSDYNTFYVAQGNRMGNFCTGNTITNVGYGLANYNTIGNHCYNNTISAYGTHVGNDCYNIISSMGAGLINCFFTDGVSNKTFEGGSYVDGLKIVVKTSINMVIPVDDGDHDYLIVDKRDSSGGLWCTQVDTSGVVTVIKFE